MLVVLDKDLTTPPIAPAVDDTYLIYGVGDVGTAWEGWQGSIARWWKRGQAWERFILGLGNVVYCLDDATMWIQEDSADPPTWTQILGGGAAGLKQVQLSISGTILPSTGLQPGWVRSPIAGVITSWELVANTAGSVVLDVYKAAYAAAPPIGGSMVGAGTKPALAAAQRAQGNVATWTGSVAIAVGDYLRLNVVSVAAITSLSLKLIV